MQPVNAERGEVWLQTDAEGGVVLRLGSSELCALETMLDVPLGVLVERFNSAGLGLRDLRAVLAAAMQRGRPGATLDDAAQVMDAVGLEEIGDAIRLCFERSMPLAKGKGRRPPEAAAGTGENS